MPDSPRRYRPPLNFEWDERKAASNAAKHGVTFDDAIDLFSDAGHFVVDASRAGDGETRWKALGIISGRLFSVVFTWRGAVARLISARPANPKEERLYGNRKSNS